jgi:hypothetical protein
MWSKKHRTLMMDQHSTWRTEGIVGDVNCNKCKLGDDVDADEEEPVFHEQDGSAQIVQNGRYSR